MTSFLKSNLRYPINYFVKIYAKSLYSKKPGCEFNHFTVRRNPFPLVYVKRATRLCTVITTLLSIASGTENSICKKFDKIPYIFNTQCFHIK